MTVGKAAYIYIYTLTKVSSVENIYIAAQTAGYSTLLAMDACPL